MMSRNSLTPHPQHCEHNELCDAQNYLHIKYALVYFTMLSVSAGYSRDEQKSELYADINKTAQKEDAE